MNHDTIPIAAQIAEAKRELGMRFAVYKKRVEAGTMTPLEQELKIALQKAIIASLERLQSYDRAAVLAP